MVILKNSTDYCWGMMFINDAFFDLVKGPTIGGILTNFLPIPGLSSAMTSSFRFREQRFDREGLGLQPTLLLLSMI
jgi:Ca2+/H+ antiporter